MSRRLSAASCAPPLLAALVWLAPAAAGAWGLVVPAEPDGACVPLVRHEVALAADAVTGVATSVTTLGLRAQPRRAGGPNGAEEAAPAGVETHAFLLVAPEVGGVAPAVTLDGVPLALERLDAAAGTQWLLERARAGAPAELLAASGRALHLARFDVMVDASTAFPAIVDHTLVVTGAPEVDWSAHPARLFAPMRHLGTACSALAVQASLRLHAATPIASVLTPFQDATVEGTGSTDVAVSAVSAASQPCEDLLRYVALAATPEGDDFPVAVDVLSYRAPVCVDGVERPGADAGYVAALAGPTTRSRDERAPKDLVFVVDTSGSMSGAKLEQVRRALGALLEGLGPRDCFDLVTFSDAARPAFGALRAADAEALAAAHEAVAALTADGSTNLNDGLLTALAELRAVEGEAGRPRLVLFLTDGLATAGVTEPDAILAGAASAGAAARVFTFGVGFDVNTYLLDALARGTGGQATYLRPGEAIDAALAAFGAAVQAPLATGLALEGAGVALSGFYPERLPDLFVGGSLLAVGRYGDAAAAALRLAGRVPAGPRARVAPSALVRVGTEVAFLPRLWASRRLGELLYAARLDPGDSARVDEVRALALRHGFVTPFTPFLVGPDGRVTQSYDDPTAAMSGEAAVSTSAFINDLSGNSNAAAYGASGGAAPMKQVLDRTFVRDGRYWLDTTLPAGWSELDPIDIAWGGAAWRTLLDASGETRALLAAGRDVVFAWRCRVVRVTSDVDFVPPAGAAGAAPVPVPAPRPGEDALPAELLAGSVTEPLPLAEAAGGEAPEGAWGEAVGAWEGGAEGAGAGEFAGAEGGGAQEGADRPAGHVSGCSVGGRGDAAPALGPIALLCLALLARVGRRGRARA